MISYQIVPILQLAIGPAITISGAGLVLLSMTNRFDRGIDQSGRLAGSTRSDSNCDSHGIQSRLLILTRRARMIRLAIALASVSLVLLAVFLVIAFYIAALMGFEVASLIAMVFILCMGSLIIGLLFFIADLNLSLSALKFKIDLEKG